MPASVTFTRGADVVTPWDRIGFDVDQDAATKEHEHLDGAVGYSVAADRPRKGPWRLFFLDADTAEAARLKFAQPGPWVVTDPVEAVQMTVVRSGRMRQVQQDNRARWVLEVGFAEVIS